MQSGETMIAIDTNIIVRFLTRDDEQQYQKAYQIFALSEHIFISTTVILETEWVLRFSYHFSVERIIFALSNLLALDNVSIENKTAIISALQWHQQGMDFADALHLAGCFNKAETFATFDRGIYNKANLINLKYPITLL